MKVPHFFNRHRVQESAIKSISPCDYQTQMLNSLSLAHVKEFDTPRQIDIPNKRAAALKCLYCTALSRSIVDLLFIGISSLVS